MLIKCHYITVEVTKSVMASQRLNVFAHELQILDAMYEDNAAYVGICKAPPKELDLEEEYERLILRWGSAEGGAPWCEVVFGRVMGGGLQDAMENSFERYVAKEEEEAEEQDEEEAAKKTVAKKSKAKTTKKKADHYDSVLGNKRALRVLLKELDIPTSAKSTVRELETSIVKGCKERLGDEGFEEFPEKLVDLVKLWRDEVMSEPVAA